MTETVPPETTTTPPQSIDAAPAAPARRPSRTRTSSVRIALIAGTAVLLAVLIFILQNTSAVGIKFLGAHLHVSLAVAMLLAAVAGALIMAAAGTARITQLRHRIRRDRRNSGVG
jgi:putative membrane protein